MKMNYILSSFQGAYSTIPKFLHFLVEAEIKKSGASLFQNRTVKELLWGYFDPIRKDYVGVFYPVSTGTCHFFVHSV